MKIYKITGLFTAAFIAITSVFQPTISVQASGLDTLSQKESLIISAEAAQKIESQEAQFQEASQETKPQETELQEASQETKPQETELQEAFQEIESQETELQEEFQEAEIEKMAIVYLEDYYTVKAEPSITAEDVVVVRSGQTVFVDETDIYNGDAWFKVHFEIEDIEYQGYIEEKNLAYSDERLIQWRNENLSQLPSVLNAGEREGISADIAQFPKSYQRKLMELKQKHPNWVFVKMNTGLEWMYVVTNELNPSDRSLVPTSSPASWKNGVTKQPSWSYATENIVKYYLDPRNFLSETGIFQFEQLTFNPSYHTVAAVQNFLNRTFMAGYVPGSGQTYAELFWKVGAELGFSPFHIASRIYQEQGQGKSPLISGTYPGYEGLYNYFNIGATGATDRDVIVNGLNYARKQGWYSPEAAIRGGAKTLLTSYILRGQDTLYLQKFDVESQYNGLFWHQYMQNICAPTSEALSMRRLYESTGNIESNFVFKIPVYENMPGNACGKPADYTDVYLGTWQYEYVSYVVTNGLMIGKDAVQFAPNDSLQRCELSLILYNIAGKPNVTYSPIFPDVPEGQWYSLAVTWANANGIVSGYDTGYFGTTDNINREQLALMLYKTAQLEGINTSFDINVLAKFPDGGWVSDWAKEAMAWAIQNGIIAGKGDVLAPLDSTTRAEAAAMIYRYTALWG